LGEIAVMMLDGILCEGCGAIMEDIMDDLMDEEKGILDGPGHSMKCAGCADEEEQ
jgi:hypothetical protein